MQAVPVTIVQEVSGIIYRDLGVANADITRWTSLIAIPWSIKLLWGPLVDVNFTKRKWVLTMQGLITLVLMILPWVLHLPHAFAISLGTLFVAAIFSATCDIATDGFYLLALKREEQSAYVGIQATFYRLGRLFCIGLLVMFAGILMDTGWFSNSRVNAWSAVLVLGALVYGTGWALLRFSRGPTRLPEPEADVERTHNREETLSNIYRTVSIVALAFFAYFTLNSVVRLTANALSVGLRNQEDLHGWALTPAQVQAEWTQLPLCALGAAIFFVLARRMLRGTEMAEAFGSFLRNRGI